MPLSESVSLRLDELEDFLVVRIESIMSSVSLLPLRRFELRARLTVSSSSSSATRFPPLRRRIDEESPARDPGGERSSLEGSLSSTECVPLP